MPVTTRLARWLLSPKIETSFTTEEASMSYVLGIDIGGTFTDFVSFNQETNIVEAWKNLSTPEDPFKGV